MRKERGFTIVELLIVIVIIAILAAIVVVAYNGIQNRAKKSSAQETASNIAKKAEAFNADQGVYPDTLTDLTGAAQNTPYYVPTTAASVSGTVYTAAPTDPKQILFYNCVTSGADAGVIVGYWDYVANAAVSTASTFTAGDVSGTCTLATA